MQSNLGILLKTEFLKISGLNLYRYESDKKKKRRIRSTQILLIFVAVMMAGYCFAFTYGLGKVGMIDVVPGYALTITALVILFFTFFKTNGVLFASKDYEMLMALPVKIQDIITVKFLSMYLNNLLLAVVVMGAMGIGYAVWSGITLLSFLTWIVVTLLAPLLPMAIAAAVGLFIMSIGSGARHKVLVQVLLTVGSVVAIMVFSYWMQGEAIKDPEGFMVQMKDMGSMLSDSLHKIYPLSAWFDQSLRQQNIIYLLLFVAVSLLVYGVFLFVCAKSYRRIHTALSAHHVKSNYQVGELKTNSVLMTLVKKEAKRFTSSTVYMTNVGMGLVLALLVSIASAVMGVEKMLILFGVPENVNVIDKMAYVMPFAIAMIVNMTCTTSVSLSLEGKNLWIVKSLPITTEILLQGKMLFNILLVLPVSLVCNILFMIQLKVSVLMMLGYVFVSVSSVCFSTTFGMWMNLRFANYEWENEVQVIKQSMSSTIAIFGSMIGYMILAAAAFILGSMVDGELIVCGLGMALAVAGYVFYRRCR